MIASDLYAQCLSTLTDARAAMLSPEWIEAQETQSKETRRLAGLALIQVGQAIAALSNAQLSDIANEMADLEPDIKEATQQLNDSLDTLTKVQAVLNSVTSLVGIVAKIVPLV